MSIEDRIQPVVTVAAFDPMTDSIVVLERSQDAKNNPGLFELVGGKIELLDTELVTRLILEVRQEIGATLTSNSLALQEIVGIDRPNRQHLLSYRYTGAYSQETHLTISPEEAREHPKYRLVTATTFEDLNYVPGIREFLRRLFAEQKRTGTLLSTLKQPIYIRPLFFDYEGEQIIVPMETVKGGQPQTFVRDEHLHVHEVLAHVVHTYLNPKTTSAQVLRLRTEPKRLLWNDTGTPIWQMDYGIAVTPHTAANLQTHHKTMAIPAAPSRKLAIPSVTNYNAEARQALLDIKQQAAPFLLSGTMPTKIHFDRRHSKRPRIT